MKPAGMHMTRVDKADLREYGASGKSALKFSYIEFLSWFTSLGMISAHKNCKAS